jgi:hypothetical protein
MRAALLALLMLAGAAGCSQYHYYDIDVALDTNFSQLELSGIQTCHLTVTGADSFSGPITTDKSHPGVCQFTNGRNLGTIEYSSLADSGSLTFKFDVFDDPNPTPNCLTGEGTVTTPVSGTTVTQSLTVVRGAGCACDTQVCTPTP